MGKLLTYDELEAENAVLRRKTVTRYWRCPCGDLVIRDTHYDLECGKCKRVMVDTDELVPDVEMHKLWVENAKLRKLCYAYYDACPFNEGGGCPLCREVGEMKLAEADEECAEPPEATPEAPRDGSGECLPPISSSGI